MNLTIGTSNACWTKLTKDLSVQVPIWTQRNQARLREINKELSTLGITFSNNVLNENNAFQLFVDKKEDLAGLPEWFCQSAAEEAKAAGQPGKMAVHPAQRQPPSIPAIL